MGAEISERSLEHSLGVLKERGLLCLSTESATKETAASFVLGPMFIQRVAHQESRSPVRDSAITHALD